MDKEPGVNWFSEALRAKVARTVDVGAIDCAVENCVRGVVATDVARLGDEAVLRLV